MQYNNISVMTAKEYCIAFCEGYFYAQLGERLTSGKVTEHTLDFAIVTGKQIGRAHV